MSELLNELEIDALTEMVNIGVGRAATSLRDMVGEQVLLSVPKVNLVSRDTAIRTLSENEVSHLVGIHQVFEGDITGRALLIFPDTKSLELVRAVIGGELPPRGDHRARTGSPGRDRQHHPERLPGDHRQPAAAQSEDVAAGDPARRAGGLLQPRVRHRKPATS